MKFSKKLTMLVVAVLLLILDGQGYLDLGEQHITAIRWTVVAYIGGQSLVDAFLKPEQIRAVFGKKAEPNSTTSNVPVLHVSPQDPKLGAQTLQNPDTFTDSDL